MRGMDIRIHLPTHPSRCTSISRVAVNPYNLQDHYLAPGDFSQPGVSTLATDTLIQNIRTTAHNQDQSTQSQLNTISITLTPRTHTHTHTRTNLRVHST